MSKQQPPIPPQEALPDGEANPFLAKFKTSLCKQWSVSEPDTLSDIVCLATYLWALNRPEEAVAVAEAIAVAVPAPVPLPKGGFDMTNWSEAATAHALVVRLARQPRPERAAVSLATLFANPGITRDNHEYLADRVTQAREELAALSKRRMPQWKLGLLAGLVGDMVQFAELAAAGDSAFAPYAEDATILLPQLLERLGAELQRA